MSCAVDELHDSANLTLSAESSCPLGDCIVGEHERGDCNQIVINKVVAMDVHHRYLVEYAFLGESILTSIVQLLNLNLQA